MAAHIRELTDDGLISGVMTDFGYYRPSSAIEALRLEHAKKRCDGNFDMRFKDAREIVEAATRIMRHRYEAGL